VDTLDHPSKTAWPGAGTAGLGRQYNADAALRQRFGCLRGGYALARNAR
jgi:hypothetical protein